MGPVPQASSDDAPARRPLSFADLYRARYEPMVRLAHLLTGSAAVAEELVQDAFVRVHDRWEGAAHPEAYLRAAVVNACRSHHRRLGIERRRRPAPSGFTVVDRPDEVWDALAALPSRQRAALVLRFYEDLPEAEIARLLGCRPGTVKSLVHRGLAELRKVIEP